MITEQEMDEMKLQVREAIRLYRKEYKEATLGERQDVYTPGQVGPTTAEKNATS